MANLPERMMSDKTREGMELEKPHAIGSHTEPKPMAGKSGERRAHQKAITQGLRKFFDTVAAEPVPDEFMELLKKMDDSKGGGQ
jgi:Anti-sigma factor NepR